MRDNRLKIIPRPEVVDFAVTMEAKLRANDHKGGWGSCDADTLVQKLEFELAELKLALQKQASTPYMLEELIEEVRRECADVANFAMMISDNFS